MIHTQKNNTGNDTCDLLKGLLFSNKWLDPFDYMHGVRYRSMNICTPTVSSKQFIFGLFASFHYISFHLNNNYNCSFEFLSTHAIKNKMNLFF